MSASAPASPYQAATIGSSKTQSAARAAAVSSGGASGPSSGYATPALTASAGPTPDFLTRVVTPQDELPEFDLGDAAIPLPSPGTGKGKSQAAVAPGSADEYPAKLEKEDDAAHVPECWGHRGASATYPENTKASFVEACRQGAEGIETDIHITADNELVLFHDPRLEHLTDGQGRIREKPWKGVLEHIRTKAQPAQPIPQFREVLGLLLENGNEHVKLNLDCKVDNDADKLFRLIGEVLAEFEGWQTSLAPRIVLGLWHPKFILPAKLHLPFLPRYAISMSIPDARAYFWSSVHGFSVYYSALATPKGQAFLRECKEGGKKVCAWTVNREEAMRDCARWGVGSVITDKPALWRKVKGQILADRARALKPTLQTYVLPWLTKASWSWDIAREARIEMEYLEKEGGRFEDWKVDAGVGMTDARPVVEGYS